MTGSLVPRWLVLPLASTGLVTVGGSSALPTVVSGVTTTQQPGGSGGSSSTSEIPATRIGMNLAGASYYSGNRAYVNLAGHDKWRLVHDGSWGSPASDQLDSKGNFIRLDGTDYGAMSLSRPASVMRRGTADIVCRWEGTGKVTLMSRPSSKNVRYRGKVARFTYAYEANGNAVLTVKDIDGADPVRNIDCREANADPDALFTNDYIESVKRYETVRFMDWQLTNNNSTVTWDKRSQPGQARYTGVDGYPLEHMIALANAAHVNPWFCMPWNADDNYIRRFAEMVRDTLDPELTAYIETSNEVWNWNFPVTTQARDEGLARGLSTDPTKAFLYRYAERVGEVSDIWSDVFQQQEERIVRVIANQNAIPWNMSNIMKFRDTASKVDAIASAPYFEANIDSYYTDTPGSITILFANLRNKIDERIGQAKEYRDIANQYGKRFITYEGGQHITGSNTTLQAKIQRDPRMGQLYAYYLSSWQKNVGDTIVLFNDVSPVHSSGAWGMFEYFGQPLRESPKAWSTNLFMTSLGQ